MTGPIQVGERVLCRGGAGVLEEQSTGGSITIKLLPWGTIKSYTSVTKVT